MVKLGDKNEILVILIRGCSFIMSYYFGLFWTPTPLKSYCVIIWLTPPYPPHVWRDKWIRYFIERIIFKHHFKGVGELLINLEWWNQLLFNLIHIVIVKLLYFQAKSSPFLCVFCFDLAIIFMPFRPPPVIVIHHNCSYPHPPPCHNVSYFRLPPLPPTCMT